MQPIVSQLPIRPDLSLLAIIGYAVFAFALGLVLTPWFISFLRRNSLGKTLRVETVDGREPTIFRQYHEKKFGTPTMGGLLIWGSIFLTVIISRVLAFTGAVQNSILQRGQVYLPMFVLFTMGVLGALDDYLNIASSSDERLHQSLPTIKKLAYGGLAVFIIAIVLLFALGGGSALTDPKYRQYVVGAVVVLLLLLFLALRASATVVDDWFRHIVIAQGKKKGLGVLPKITSLLLISLIGAYWFSIKLGYDSIAIPFYGSVYVGLWYIPIFMFILVGTANAVNVTDGLDGLAGGLLVIAFGAFGVVAYLQGLYVLAGFCAVSVGAIAAFLWHNVPPALFYMGDTGALALGGTLGVIALMTDQVLILPLVGFVFVIEMLSVIIQLTSKRLRGGKKVFKAAPFHHHLEALEWGESKVTMRLWIIGGIVALFGIIIGIYGTPDTAKKMAPSSSTTNQPALP